MNRITDKHRSEIKIGDWVRMTRTDYNGDFIEVNISQIVKMDECSIVLNDGTYISDGDPLKRVSCLELMTDEEEIMLAILENA